MYEIRFASALGAEAKLPSVLTDPYKFDSEDSALAIPISREFVDKKKLSLSWQEDIEGYDELRDVLTKPVPYVLPFSGQHRAAAMRGWKTYVAKRIDEALEVLAKIFLEEENAKQEKNEENMTEGGKEEAKKQNDRLEQKKKRYTDVVAYGKQLQERGTTWMIRLYDGGA